MIDGEPAAKTRDNCRCDGTQHVNCWCEGGGDGDSSYIDIAVSGVMFSEMLNVGLGAVIGLRYADACQLLFHFPGDDADNSASRLERGTRSPREEYRDPYPYGRDDATYQGQRH